MVTDLQRAQIQTSFYWRLVVSQLVVDLARDFFNLSYYEAVCDPVFADANFGTAAQQLACAQATNYAGGDTLAVGLQQLFDALP